MHMVYKENYSHIKHKPQSFYCLLCFFFFKKTASECGDAWSSNDCRKGSRAYVH